MTDIGVLLSTNGEGISNALLEFSALAKPIIATRAAGNLELIEEGFNGYLIDSLDNKDLSSKITLILDDEELKIKLGRNGENKVKTQFHIKKMVASFEELYYTFIRE